MSDERELTPLEAALASSFSYSPNTNAATAVTQPAPTTATAATVPPQSVSESSSSASEPEWTAEYDERLSEWRAAAAVARDKAEKERAKWESIRAEEAKAGVVKPTLSSSTVSMSMSGWESVGASTAASVRERDSPSPADVRDLVAGEKQGGHGQNVLQEVLGPKPHASTSGADTTTDEDSGKSQSLWENVPSMSSSVPSLPQQHPPQPLQQPQQAPKPKPAPPPPARSITLLLFDSTTTTRTRLLALAATLGINFLLPFVNGVMIGFGEIAAKGVVNWWRTGTKLSSTALGLRAAPVI